MRQLIFFVLLFCLPTLQYAQTLKGIVYDANGIVKNIKIHNKTQNRFTISDEEGLFSLVAKVNDSIYFESVFYHGKTIRLKPSHFEDLAVFELKEILTELDEVEVKEEAKQPIFHQDTYNYELQELIKADIKNNPHLYLPENATYGVDLVYLIGAVVKLFKKNKKRDPVYQPITYKQLDSLFDNSSFFNKQLVTESLEIPEDRVHLFYDFCEGRQISSELLKEEKKMQLLEELVLSSQLFLILLEEYGQENINKD
ncbi:hypothetical protein DFQ11_10271 [Winogradskyella epiphytica]|uniref:Carboxypeptidase-like protein n=1 Tax=Winogradskyella epiphytica TaxID=262005 RepID=A0A2V4XZB6_9FLAO|nr:hypothetical protein [Winogradskyella epiphytica]PYE81498.1 hypothetical protein DFQ11_10271 [Winogradskyella epiphytica]GGW64743.1 hypothetical protein GCM10008085_15950 [Winogradskyella epiphytica]